MKYHREIPEVDPLEKKACMAVNATRSTAGSLDASFDQEILE